jgi:hypothetical protein
MKMAPGAPMEQALERALACWLRLEYENLLGGNELEHRRQEAAFVCPHVHKGPGRSILSEKWRP